jgi:hypothetical protein
MIGRAAAQRTEIVSHQCPASSVFGCQGFQVVIVQAFRSFPCHHTPITIGAREMANIREIATGKWQVQFAIAASNRWPCRSRQKAKRRAGRG